MGDSGDEFYVIRHGEASVHVGSPGHTFLLKVRFWVKGLGGFGFRVLGSGFRVSGRGSQVQGLGFRILGSGLGDLGCRA